MGERDDGREGRLSHLGVCPDCETEIPTANLLIMAESSSGWPRMLAKCPECGEIVSPV